MNYRIGDQLPETFQPGDTISEDCVVSKCEKMSKSRGNVIGVDEVVCGVCRLAPGYEFRDIGGNIIVWAHVWFDKGAGYRTKNKKPVFLHIEGNPIPVLLGSKIQHPQERDFWGKL